jgi:hypothetical protein
MILSASEASSSGLSKKRHFPDSESESDDDSDDDLVSISESDTDYVDDPIKKLLKSTLVSVGVDNKEEDLIGKRYGVICHSKKKLILYVAKIGLNIRHLQT